MEFVPGRTLDQCIGRNGLTLKDSLSFGIQIADALARAHSAGIVHRDLKPANVIVTENVNVKLLDFGFAKLTEVAVEGDPEATVTAESSPSKRQRALSSAPWRICRLSRQRAGRSMPLRYLFLRLPALRNDYRPARISGRNATRGTLCDSPERP